MVINYIEKKILNLEDKYIFRIRLHYNKNIDILRYIVNIKTSHAIYVAPVENCNCLGYFLKLDLSHLFFVTDLNLLASHTFQRKKREKRRTL